MSEHQLFKNCEGMYQYRYYVLVQIPSGKWVVVHSTGHGMGIRHGRIEWKPCSVVRELGELDPEMSGETVEDLKEKIDVALNAKVAEKKAERLKPIRAKGHKLTMEWSGERGAESSSTGFCTCGWSESASSQNEVRHEYREHLKKVLTKKEQTNG